MGRTLTEQLNRLPKKRRDAVERRASELIDEELTLRQLRQALDLTQAELARKLNIGQDTVSRLERRTDLLLSTLSGYIEALGGTLQLQVEFPGHRRISLKQLHEPKERDEAA